MSGTSKPGEGSLQAPEFKRLVDGALYWAEEWDLPVFPLHGIEFDEHGENGICDCSDGKDCTSPGKHPWETGGKDRATTDPEEIRALWRKYPGANVGLVTGGPLQVLDIDSALGEKILAEHWSPPPTLEVTTGKGRHLYFVTEEGFHASNTQGGKGDRSLGKGIDTRGDGGVVVTAPSWHVSGARYTVVPREPAELPKTIAARLQSIGTVRLVPPTVEQVSQHPNSGPQYRKMVETIVNRIRNAGEKQKRRHFTILNGVRWLAGYFHLQVDLTAEQVFGFIFEAINEAYPDDRGRRGGYRTAHDAWNHGLLHPFDGLPGTTKRIEEEDERPYILSQGAGFWVATSGHDRSDSTGSFAYYPEKKAVAALQYEWPGIRTWVPKTSSDGDRPMSANEAFDYYGQAYVEDVVYSYTKRATYDPEARRIVVPARLKPPPPAKFHPEVDAWMRRIAEDPADTEKLLDWCATAPILDRPTSALVITGSAAIGKQMMVLGMCAYFGVDPVSYDVAVRQFNWQLAFSPIIWLDEVARNLGRTGGFRRLVANSVHPIEQKKQPVATLHGNPRLMAFANGPDPFGMAQEDLTIEDEDAIGSRLLQITANEAAARYLEELGGRDYTGGNRWVEEHIPRHIQWLHENREVVHGSRLLVSGDAAAWARRVTSKTGLRGQALEMLRLETDRLLAAAGPPRFTGSDPTCFLDGEVVWASNKGMREAWTRVFNEPAPSHVRLSKALRGLSKVEGQRKTFGSHRAKVFPVPLDLVLED